MSTEDIQSTLVGLSSQQLLARQSGTVNPMNGLPYSAKYQQMQAARVLLPAYAHMGEVLDAVRNHAVVFVGGEPGCGKTTQVAQGIAHFLHENQTDGNIRLTQPRRSAVTSTAARIAAEMDVILGKQVGYRMRGESSFERGVTRVEVMTDGLLLKDLGNDNQLEDCAVLIMDEWHERGVNQDKIAAAAKRMLLERRDFRVVIMSATADIDTVNRYFSPHTMAIIHLPAIPHSRIIEFEEVAVHDVTERTAEIITRIITNPPAEVSLKNVLVFMPGQEEVLHTVEAIRKVIKVLEPSAKVFPLYASMVNRAADQALHWRGSRSIFVATNIGETSITFPGLGFVIDSGLIKQSKYHSVNHYSTLWVTNESKAAGAQRAGRAGREGPGKVYRLFTAEEWEKFPAYDEVPLLLEDYSVVALDLLALGYPSLDMVNLPTDPSPGQNLRARDILLRIGAIDEHSRLSDIGRKMTRLPMSPMMGRSLVAAVHYGCAEMMVNLASILSSSRYLFVKEDISPDDLSHIKSRMSHPESDLLSLVNLYAAYEETHLDNSWARDNSINVHAFQEASRVKANIVNAMSDVQLSWTDNVPISDPAYFDNFTKAIIVGHHPNLVQLVNPKTYKSVRRASDQLYTVDRYSQMQAAPSYLVYQEAELSMTATDEVTIKMLHGCRRDLIESALSDVASGRV